MAAERSVQCRVTDPVKQRLRLIAKREGRSESEVVRNLLDTMLRTQPDAAELAVETVSPRGGGPRLWLRLEPHDRRRLADRAAALRLPASTYVAVLVRSHLGQVAPPVDEQVRLLRQEIRQLAALSRHVAQLTDALEDAGSVPASLKRETLTMLAICTQLRDHTRALLQAHIDSWEIGHDVEAR